MTEQKANSNAKSWKLTVRQLRGWEKSAGKHDAHLYNDSSDRLYIPFTLTYPKADSIPSQAAAALKAVQAERPTFPRAQLFWSLCPKKDKGRSNPWRHARTKNSTIEVTRVPGCESGSFFLTILDHEKVPAHSETRVSWLVADVSIQNSSNKSL
jgi:hypothetical protein